MAGQKHNNQTGSHLTPAVVETFLEVQAKEIELKSQEIALREKELEIHRIDTENNKEVAKDSIAAQLEDSKLKQKYFLSVNRSKYILLGIISLGVLGFLFFSMYMQQTDFAERIVDIVVGAIGGFAVGKTGAFLGARRDDE